MNAKLSIVGFAVAVGSLVALAYHGELFGWNPITLTLQVLALALMIWARVTFGMRSFHAAATTTEGGLVTHGPYAYVRNPIYAAVIVFTWAGVGANLNLVSGALGLLVLVGMLVRIFAEERELRAQYEDKYTTYCLRVKRLVPGVF